MGVEDHKKKAVRSANIAIVTLSDTRTLETDGSGGWLAKQATANGHSVIRHSIIPDDRRLLRDTVMGIIEQHSPDMLLTNGGTGAGHRDITIETIKPLFQKELTAFGVLFTQLSFEEIGAAAILSRAAAGVIRTTAVFCMPGSLKAVQLAFSRLILPEIGHLTRHLRTN